MKKRMKMGKRFYDGLDEDIKAGQMMVLSCGESCSGK
jgi:hypothetical protein